jgi:hypothetical protein
MTDISQIWQFDLRQGNSPSPRQGACLLDAVSWFEYGELGDHPACVCPVIAAFGRIVNDALDDTDRQRLKPFIPRLVGTVDPEAELARAEYLAWQSIRVFLPFVMEIVGVPSEAERLRTFKGSLKDACRRATVLSSHITVRPAYNAVASAGHAAAEAAAALARDSRARFLSGQAASCVTAATLAAQAAADALVLPYYASMGQRAPMVDAVIAALDGVLKIGRQAAPIAPERLARAAQSFALARCAREEV